jgi:threonine synthase
MLHPHGRISEIQKRQMTTVLDENVHNVAIEGDFDDCQRIVKSLASDLDFKSAYALGAVNSINWARVMAQIVYYFRAFLELHGVTGAEAMRVCVPTGNFGNILAGWYAMKMGLPIERLILATNENDILARFFSSGEYVRGEVVQTLSPAMDIQAPSNFERYLFYRVGRDHARVRALMEQFAEEDAFRIEPGEDGAVDPDFEAAAAGVEECLDAIRRYHGEHGYLLDPHTAIGVAVAEKAGLAGSPIVCVSTAHPAKFPEAIERAVGEDIAHHPDIDALMELPTRCTVLPDDREAVREFITDTVG